MSKAQHMRLVGLFTEAGELGEERDLTDGAWLWVEHEVKLGGSTSAVVRERAGPAGRGRSSRPEVTPHSMKWCLQRSAELLRPKL